MNIDEQWEFASELQKLSEMILMIFTGSWRIHRCTAHYLNGRIANYHLTVSDLRLRDPRSSLLTKLSHSYTRQVLTLARY